jgi:hypothetical protein
LRRWKSSSRRKPRTSERTHPGQSPHLSRRCFPTSIDEDPQFGGIRSVNGSIRTAPAANHTLEVETRGMKRPGVLRQRHPLHDDNGTIVEECICLDQADRNLLHDDITTIDNALTRPWLVKKTYRE